MSQKPVEKRGRIHQILDELRDVEIAEQGRRLLSVIGNIDLSKGRPAKRIATADAIYHMSFRELTDRSRPREQDDKEYVGRSLIGRTICAHEVLLLCSAAHMTWPKKIWSSLHLSYRHAAKLGLTDYRRPSGEDEASVVETYAMALVLGLSDPFKMPNRGIYVTQEFIHRNRNAVKICE